MPADQVEELMARAGEEIEAVEALVDRRIAGWVVGFHCQQVAEKTLKAVLVSKGVAPRKIHDLVALMDDVRDAGIPVPPWFQDLEDLNPFAVQLRYETLGAVADFDARHAQDLATRVYEWAQLEVGWRGGTGEREDDEQGQPEEEGRPSGGDQPPSAEDLEFDEMPF